MYARCGVCSGEHSNALVLKQSFPPRLHVQAQCGDITLVDAPEGYDQLWNKVRIEFCLHELQ